MDPLQPLIADRSARSKGGLDCGKQICIVEWLEQDSHSSLFGRPRPDSLIRLSSDENNRNLVASKLQFSLEIQSGHTGHRDVQNETSGPIHATGREKFLRRRKGAGFETKLL